MHLISLSLISPMRFGAVQRHHVKLNKLWFIVALRLS